ncbi:hypothetical protein [Glutamicibacter sp. 2E12]|uniref:hypothetical protein n=1 Tax=Glutamicibacter sp. 2E12 TaxID=3416181 RepID=UPI003CED589F
MRVVLFDGIQEMHVIRSLGRAFQNRGHHVYQTGKLTSGFEYITEGQDLELVQRSIDDTIEFKPDIIIVFRPSALPIPLLRRLRISGAKLYVWLSDDPVLWNQTYKYSINEYDVVLHCGGKPILDFYESKFGYPTGINFPFWTDSIEFPYSYGKNEPESDLLFLGNAVGPIRRQRYYDLGLLSSSLKIHGNVNPDYLGLSGGYLDTQEEIRRVGSSAKIAVNIPQYFQTYKDQPMWFKELGDLGYFETPSRIVQYAAMGLPIVSLEPDNISASSFQNSLRVADIATCESLTRNLLESDSLQEISIRTYDEFTKYYQAASRVMAIESLMESDSWKAEDSNARSSWYRQFESNLHDHPTDGTNTNTYLQDSTKHKLSSTAHRGSEDNKKDGFLFKKLGENVLLIGERWKFTFSPSNVFYRQIASLGINVTKFDIFGNGKNFSITDPTEVFARIINVNGFEDNQNKEYDSIILIGDNYSIDKKSRKALADRGTVIISQTLLGPEVTMRTKILSSISDAITSPDKSMVAACKQAGIKNVVHIPDMVDEDFIVASKRIERNSYGITLLFQREGHKALHADIVTALSSSGAEILVADDFESADDIGKVAEKLATDLLIVFPDPSRPGNLNSKFLGHGLLMASQVAHYRVPGRTYTDLDRPNFFLFSSLEELLAKYDRIDRELAESGSDAQSLISYSYSGKKLLGLIISFIDDSHSARLLD